MEALSGLAPAVGVHAACLALGVPRATFYRQHARQHALKLTRVGELLAPEVGMAAAPAGVAAIPTATPVGVHPRALSIDERQAVLAVLHSERFCDVAPAEAYATLLDEGTYLASERTMYRLLAAAGRVPGWRRPPDRVASHAARVNRLRGPVPLGIPASLHSSSVSK